MKSAKLVLSVVVALAASLAIAQPSQVDEQKELKELKRVETLQQRAKAAYTKKPKDAKLRAEYIKLTLVLANNTQASMALSSKDKYPKALRLYREVLKIEPKNGEALENKNRIESIYRSMGRPIPK